MAEPNYRRTTRSIEVTVTPTYLAEDSEPARDAYVWAYRIRIENLGAETVQLRTRHWRITDAFGHLQEVRGDGVIGEQPVLRPGDHFEYESRSGFLHTRSGVMLGTYQMETTAGERFDVQIPAFFLESPHQPAEQRLH